MIRYINNLNIGYKLLLMGLLLVPTAVVGSLLLGTHNLRISQTRSELQGLEHMRPFLDLLWLVDQHRLAAAEARSGKATNDQALALEREIHTAIGDMQATNAANGDRFGTKDLAGEIAEGWQGVEEHWQSSSLNQSLDAHNLLIAQLSDAIRITGENSGLVRDTEPGIANLGTGITVLQPGVIDILGQTGAMVTALNGAGPVSTTALPLLELVT